MMAAVRRAFRPRWTRVSLSVAGAFALAAVSLVATDVTAAETTGKPGSPSATTTISGKQLPAPDPKFGGVIKNDALQSKAWWAPRIVPPKKAPNILLIMTDDSGFGVPSTFGGVIPTPTMDRIAQRGPALQQHPLHRPLLPDARRADHRAQPPFGGLRRDLGAVDRISRYATSWFGKDHNTPAFAASQVGPFDQWPTGMGFEYFYGFVGGDANQWQPNLFRNTTQIYPFEGKPGWNLITGMADDAIDYLNRINQTDAQQAVLPPLRARRHPRAAPSDQGVGGQDPATCTSSTRAGTSCSEQIFENQKRLGVIPKDTQLEPWPTDVLKNWDD